MANLNHTSIPTALPASTKLDLSCDHVTTMMFGQMQPVHYRHAIKGENLNLAGIGKVRPFPLATPTYGRLRMNIHHFYVPFRVVFPQFDSFYNDTIGVNYNGSSLVDDSPYFTCADVCNMFTNGVIYANVITSQNFSPSRDPWDFTPDGSNYYKFTTLGKYVYKILVSLGYEINWDSKDNTQISALALLCYARVYLDWYANQSYMDSVDVIELKKIFAYNDPTTQLHLSIAQLGYVFGLIAHVTYDQDYFVGSWDNPFAPNSNQYSAISFNDLVADGTNNNYINKIVLNPTSSGGVQANMPTMVQGNNTNINIGTQYLHDALKVITDYSKRHQLAGATNINRTLAQYGFGVNAMRVDRSYHIGASSVDVEVGAVFSTANTAQPSDPSTLGDFAGSGKGYGSTDANFKVDELGLEISIASILPSGGYYQGMDRNNLHIKKTDFFVPEFDGLGVQTITKREIYVSNNGTYGTPSGSVGHVYDTGFGFTGRYGEYKRPRSWVSGDLRVPTRYRGGDSWHLMREFNDNSFGGITNQRHSLQFTRFDDSETYRRIFTFTEGDNDPFVVEWHWSVGSQAPCHGLFETYEFNTEGNKNVSLKSNGGVLN